MPSVLHSPESRTDVLTELLFALVEPLTSHTSRTSSHTSPTSHTSQNTQPHASFVPQLILPPHPRYYAAHPTVRVGTETHISAVKKNTQPHTLHTQRRTPTPVPVEELLPPSFRSSFLRSIVSASAQKSSTRASTAHEQSLAKSTQHPLHTPIAITTEEQAEGNAAECAECVFCFCISCTHTADSAAHSGAHLQHPRAPPQ